MCAVCVSNVPKGLQHGDSNFFLPFLVLFAALVLHWLFTIGKILPSIAHVTKKPALQYKSDETTGPGVVW